MRGASHATWHIPPSCLQPLKSEWPSGEPLADCRRRRSCRRRKIPARVSAECLCCVWAGAVAAHSRRGLLFVHMPRGAKQRGEVYESPPNPHLNPTQPPPTRSSPTLPCSASLSLCVQQPDCLPACLLPVCLVPRLKFQNFLLQATFRAASAVRVCACTHMCM